MELIKVSKFVCISPNVTTSPTVCLTVLLSGEAAPECSQPVGLHGAAG